MEFDFGKVWELIDKLLRALWEKFKGTKLEKDDDETAAN